MYEVARLFFDVTMVIVMLWIVKKFLEAFYEPKKKKLLPTAIWIFYFCFQLYVQRSTSENFILTTIVGYFVIVLLGWTGYCGFRMKNLLVMFLFYVAWILEEMMVFFFMSLFSIEKAYADFMGVLLSKIIAILGVYLFSAYWKRKQEGILPLKYFVFLLFLPIGSVYIAIHQFYQNTNIPETMVIFGILLLFHVVILEVYVKLSKAFLVEKEHAVYEQHMEMMLENTRQQQEMMENFRREKHDWVNQLIVLENQLQQGEVEQVVEKIGEVVKNCGNYTQVCNCGNKVIDAIMNAKSVIAKQKGVTFDSTIFVAESLPIDSCDLGVILGNVLDNAIQATSQCPKDHRKVAIHIGIKKEMLIILVENPYTHTLKQDAKGNFMTTKTEKKNHGYGISSVERLSQKYQGEVSIEITKKTFLMRIYLSLSMKE